MPKAQMKLVSAWATIHGQELAANWELAKVKEPRYRIEPLR